MLLVDLAQGCHLSCVYCYAEHLAPEPLVPQAFTQALRRLRPSEVCFHGREPLYDLALLRQVVYLVKKTLPRAKLSLQTNGVALQGPALEFLLEEEILPGVSLDGPWPLSRLRGSFLTMKTVEENLRLAMRAFGPGQVGVIVVLTKVNTRAPKLLAAWLENLFEAGLSGARLNPVVGHPELMPQPEEVLTLFAEVERRGLASRCYPLSERRAPQTCAFSGCSPFGTRIASLSLSGTVHPCHRQPTAYLWPGVSSLRREFLARTPYAEGGCAGCPVLDRCGGGCPQEAPDLWSRSLYCRVWKELFSCPAQAQA